MKKTYSILSFLPILLLLNSSSIEHTTIRDNSLNVNEDSRSSISFKDFALDTYTRLNEPNLSLKAFENGLKGYYHLLLSGKLSNQQYLTIIDFTVSSNSKRMFIINTENWNLITSTYVAHGMKSGEEFANEFSNIEHSHQSSIGFFLTGEIYDGKHGYSLKLDGLEYSNSNVRDRGVVIHSADYVSEEYIKQNGRLGRSHGCPALPKEGYKELVDLLCEGSCLYIHSSQKEYAKKSSIVNASSNFKLDCNGKLI
jgi:hypothetical protein